MRSKYLVLTALVLSGLWLTVEPAFAQNWLATRAPGQWWSAVASSADGSRLVATVFGGGQADTPGPIYTSADSGATWTQTASRTRKTCLIPSPINWHEHSL
jgi:hypothetical protein